MNYYHIYNHASGDEDLFRDQGNFRFFLNTVKKYLDTQCDLLAYCLMPNHFHLMVQTDLPFEKLKKMTTNMTISYAKSFNILFDRKGALFLRSCNLKEIPTEVVAHVIKYIHRNPIHHGFKNEFTQYYYCSYNDVLTDNRAYIQFDKTLSYFGDMQNFKSEHEAYKQKFEDEKKYEGWE